MIGLPQIPGGSPPATEVGALAQLLFAFAAIIGTLAFVILKLIERKDQRAGGGKTLNNGALARLEAVEKELAAVEKRNEASMVRMREDLAGFQSDVSRKFDRWDELFLEWARENARRHP